MPVSIFKIVNLAIILIMLGILSWYSWGLFFGSNYEPAEWANARKKRLIPPDLIRAFKHYEDKVRFFAFWFQIERLKREEVPGSFAELGVYKGETAKLFYLMDRCRMLHLFDTFDGLPESDLKVESGEAATYSNLNFKDTSIEEVVLKVGGDPGKIIFHKGYFPRTTQSMEEESFAFVSMDADLYLPTMAGLRYFYPRLASGGVIFIHDYTNKWEGVRKAVDEFCATIPETPVFMPDLEGTVLLVKNRKVTE